MSNTRRELALGQAVVKFPGEDAPVIVVEFAVQDPANNAEAIGMELLEILKSYAESKGVENVPAPVVMDLGRDEADPHAVPVKVAARTNTPLTEGH